MHAILLVIEAEVPISEEKRCAKKVRRSHSHSGAVHDYSSCKTFGRLPMLPHSTVRRIR